MGHDSTRPSGGRPSDLSIGLDFRSGPPDEFLSALVAETRSRRCRLSSSGPYVARQRACPARASIRGSPGHPRQSGRMASSTLQRTGSHAA